MANCAARAGTNYAAFNTASDKWPVTNLTPGADGSTRCSGRTRLRTRPRTTACTSRPGFDVNAAPLKWGDLDFVYDSGPSAPTSAQVLRTNLPQRSTHSIIFTVWQRSDSQRGVLRMQRRDRERRGSASPSASPTPTQTSASPTPSPTATVPPTNNGGVTLAPEEDRRVGLGPQLRRDRHQHERCREGVVECVRPVAEQRGAVECDGRVLRWAAVARQRRVEWRARQRCGRHLSVHGSQLCSADSYDVYREAQRCGGSVRDCRGSVGDDVSVSDSDDRVPDADTDADSDRVPDADTDTDDRVAHADTVRNDGRRCDDGGSGHHGLGHGITHERHGEHRIRDADHVVGQGAGRQGAR